METGGVPFADAAFFCGAVRRRYGRMRKKLPLFDVKGFLRGFTLPFRGARFLIANKGLKRYAILPLILNVFLYGLAILVFFHFLWNWDIYLVAWDFWGPVGRWISAVVNWMGWLIKAVVAALSLGAAFFTFTGVGMALASPLNDILSEKTEMAYIGGYNKMTLPFRFTFKAGLLSAGDSFRNLAKQFFCTLIALPFLLVPVVGFVPMFLVGAYFAGFGFLDAAMARNFLRPKHKKLLADSAFWEIVGMGSAMQACFAIPFLGMLLMPVGVVAGTLLHCRTDWEKLFAEAGVPKPEGFIPPKKEMPPGEHAPERAGIT